MTTKLNQKGKNVNTFEKVAAKRDEQLAISMNGNVQFKKEPMVRLYELAVSTLFGKDTYYRDSNTLVNDLRSSLKEVVDMGQYDFIANLALHARVEMDIRTIPIVLVVEFAKILSDKRDPFISEIKKIEQTRTKGIGTNLTNERLEQIADLRRQADQFNYANMRRLVCDVIQRADQINDMYAYALSVFGDKSKVPMAIKRGVADAFNKFNEYHFAKYNRAAEVKFRDVLRIVHPTAKDTKQGEIFEKIIRETLSVPYTWEVELSKNGQLPADQRKSNKDLWTELLMSGKIGYMALLRNLRNIIEAGVEDNVLKTYVCDILSDRERVAQSKQFPHAFILAHRAVKDIAPNGVIRAIEQALEYSCENIPQLGDNVVLLVDSSGSMQGGSYYHPHMNSSSNKNQPLAPADHASVLAAALVKGNNNAFNLNVIYFDSTARLVQVDATKPVLQQAQYLREKSIGGATKLDTAFKLMQSKNIKPDTIIVLSDMEVDRCYYGSMPKFDSDAVKIAINFAGSESTPLSQNDGWYQLSGYSDKMFKFIPAMRNKVSVVDALNIPYVGVNAVKKTLTTKVEEEVA